MAAAGPDPNPFLQARSDAVELKLKVLDDKLIRAQVSEEEKMQPLHNNVASCTENLYAERLAREVLTPPASPAAALPLLPAPVACPPRDAGAD